MPDGVLENRRFDWVSAGDQVGGYDRSELATDFAATMARVHPDDRERVLVALRAHLSGQTREFEAEGRIVQKDGSYGWIQKQFVRTLDYNVVRRQPETASSWPAPDTRSVLTPTTWTRTASRSSRSRAGSTATSAGRR